jgi:hypothetical protein
LKMSTRVFLYFIRVLISNLSEKTMSNALRK